MANSAAQHVSYQHLGNSMLCRTELRHHYSLQSSGKSPPYLVLPMLMSIRVVSPPQEAV